MKRRAAVDAIALTLLAHSARACPCQGSSGPGGAVTTQDERFGMSLTETARSVQGAFGPRGEYAALAPTDFQSALDVTALAGYRPVPEIEVAAETAFGHETTALSYVSSSRTGFGDVTTRVRWDALDEPMPFERPKAPWPALSLVAAVRAPTAARGESTTEGSGPPAGTFSGTTGSIGSSASSQGLGTWETSLAAVMLRTFGNDWQVSALGEAAYRFPDSSLGISRHLAPRVFGQLGGRYSPSNLVSIGALTDLGWEGDVTYEGDVVAQSSQRLWTISAYFLLKPPSTHFRWGALARYAPPIAGVGKNAIAATIFSISIGYALE